MSKDLSSVRVRYCTPSRSFEHIRIWPGTQRRFRADFFRSLRTHEAFGIRKPEETNREVHMERVLKVFNSSIAANRAHIDLQMACRHKVPSDIVDGFLRSLLERNCVVVSETGYYRRTSC